MTTVRVWATALALGVLLSMSALASAQDIPAETARWQRQADALRLPLLAPSAPTGFVLDSMRVRKGTCNGDFLAEISTNYVRADGAEVSLFEAYPAACADFGDVDEAGTTLVRGHLATYLWAGGGGDCFTGPEAAPCGDDGKVSYADSLALVWRERGQRIGFYVLFSNLISKAPIEAFAATLADVTPAPGRAPFWIRERGLVLGVLRGNRVRVLVGGERRVVSLAGIRAPRTCKRSASLAFARQAMPRGRMITLETDPTNGGSLSRVFAFRSDAGYLSHQTVNHRLVRAGLAKVAGKSRYRFSLVMAQRDARRAKKGLFGEDCTGPPPRPKAPAPMTPPTRRPPA